MERKQDYRSEKMESREGRGLALERKRQWEDGIPAEVRRMAHVEGSSPESIDRMFGEGTSAKLEREWREQARERAGLLGFWLSWHLAGGFRGLEDQGWNRATLFRKVKRFRTMFGAHPDEHRFDFIELDLGKAWVAELQDRL